MRSGPFGPSDFEIHWLTELMDLLTSNNHITADEADSVYKAAWDHRCPRSYKQINDLFARCVQDIYGCRHSEYTPRLRKEFFER